MAAMASKFYYVCAIQYYPDQWSQHTKSYFVLCPPNNFFSNIPLKYPGPRGLSGGFNSLFWSSLFAFLLKPSKGKGQQKPLESGYLKIKNNVLISKGSFRAEHINI